MKFFLNSSIVTLLIIISSCSGKSPQVKNGINAADTSTIADTGFTGITKYSNGQMIVKEVTFKNGVPQGLSKTFYSSGKLRQTLWYEKGIREDTARWYYEEGQIFRVTPYRNDTIDGTQIQYYRTGEVKAKLSYVKGIRTPYLEEFTSDGKLFKGYPDLIISVKDEYKSRGIYTISLERSDKSDKVKFYKGGYINGLFDPPKYSPINTTGGKGVLVLKKTGSPSDPYIEVIAEVLTGIGNNYLINKKIDLPYNDLK